MKKLINFGEVNKYLLIPAFGSIIKLISVFYTDQLCKELTSHPLINGLNEAIGMSLALIPFIIGEIKKINEKKEKFKLSQKHFVLLFCSFLIFIQKFFDCCFTHFDMTNLWLFDIIFLSVFSYYILGQKIYIHQYISFIVLFICSIIFFYLFSKYNDFTFIDVLIVIFSELSFCLAQVWFKYSFDNCDCTGWEVITYEGVLFLFLFLILLISLSNVEIKKNSKAFKIFNHIKSEEKYIFDNFDYFKNITFVEFIIFFFCAIIRGTFNAFFIFTNKFFTPSHIIIILLSDEIYISLKIDTKGDIAYIIITLLLYPIIYFSIFVLVEIIELNCFDLSKNTRRNIIFRLETEKIKEDKRDIELIYKNNTRTESNFSESNDEVSIRAKRKGRDG